ncbi:MAG: TonB-dependent receptor [Bacteroidota bacterium]|nr:TonB-dependent receptor [Bacteroidota bacterium]
MKLRFLLLAFSITQVIFSQGTLQNIKGRILDKESKQPLIGVVIIAFGKDSSNKIISSTNDDGYFKLEGMQIGRIQLTASYIGYKPISMKNVLLNSGKELVLNLEMEESITEMNEVVVSSSRKDQAVNDMTIVSARSFTVEEADKYPSSRQDPARMAGNFAGVNSTSDARNDIVIRGNSPLGLLWRLNDVDIPNPSHFAVAGSTGGPLSIINTKFLQTSDFMTGAFPAQYGNANAGVFDLKMRNGNYEKHEFTGQVGLLGLELAAEGPLSKKSKATYLAMYRYSTFELFNFFGIKIGTSAVPKYQDAAFKINLPTKNAGTFSLFGIGGTSSIDIVLSKEDAKKLRDEPDLYADQSRDQYFRTSMGVVGLQHVINTGKKGYLSSTIAQSAQQILAWHDLIYRDKNYNLTGLKRILGTDQLELRTSFNQSYNHKISQRLSLRLGYYGTFYNFSFHDSARFDSISTFRVRANINQKQYVLFQPYIQFKYKLTEKWTFHAGLHAVVQTLNNQNPLYEPRAGVNWNFRNDMTISFGYGLHSQMQPNYTYYLKPQGYTSDVNLNMGASRAHHFVLTYDYSIRSDLRIKSEVYYQYLWNIPVYPYPSSISMINQGASFSRFFPRAPMVNSGQGENYGIELTIEKFFSKNYYILFTTSFYNSKYKASDGKWRNSDFNGQFVTNLLGGYELPISNKFTLVSGTKISYAGGRWYSPADTALSRQNLDYYPVDSLVNTLRTPNYFRWDLRFGFRLNGNKVTHEFMLDLVNVLNTKNLLAYSYAPDPANPKKDPLVPNYQLGFLPLFYYKIDF